MAWIEVRDPQTRKLLFRYDPSRNLVEIAERGKTRIVDLSRYQQEQSTRQPWPPAIETK